MNGGAQPVPERSGRMAWLVLAYRLPARPGLKATIRRRLTAAGHFRDADLSQQDAALTRLSARHETIRALDAFGAVSAEQARSALATCRAVLDDFAGRAAQEQR